MEAPSAQATLAGMPFQRVRQIPLSYTVSTRSNTTMEAKMTTRNGSAEWHGDLENGSGTVTVGDGVFEGPYSYESRFGEGEGTNPEQLIAAALAGCFTMAISSILSAAGHVPESVRTNARVQLRNIEGAPTLARIDLETEGHVPGVDEPQFQAHAEQAKAACLVSRALAGIPEIVVTAKLDVPGATSNM
jgi:lipoyl-dependent peroxiredoxin